jgi:hypothetical protein
MPSYVCELCDYETHHKGTYVNHCDSKKHREKESCSEKKEKENDTIAQLTQQVMLLTQLVQQVVAKPVEPKVVKIKKKCMSVSEEKLHMETRLKAYGSIGEKIEFLNSYKPQQKKPKDKEDSKTPYGQIESHRYTLMTPYLMEWRD